MQNTDKNKDKLGWEIPLCLILFFGTFMSVDAFFTYKAISTHTGVIVKDAYKNGLKYNQTIDAVNAQNDLGWQIAMELRDGLFTTDILDREGKPVIGANVKAYIIRPVQSKSDFKLELSDNGNGKYQTRIDFPDQGQWRIRLVAKKEDKEFQTAKLFIVKL